MFAAIPSPPSGSLEIGPLQLNAYGLMIALGVFAAVWLAQKRHVARGGDGEDFVYIALRAVPAGLVGARLYHVVTDWRAFEGRWLDAFKVWEGGLGIPGGILVGALVGLWAARRRGLDPGYAADIAAPSLPLAQAIGRFGNWFNQELFGRPTDLPWGLEIDPENRPARYPDVETFHPTFLYEALWNLALVGVLLWLDRRGLVRRGRLFAVYVLGYATGRLWVELLRVDPASQIFGVRVNVWVSLVAIVGALVVLAWPSRQPRSSEPAGPPAAEPDAEPAVEPAVDRESAEQRSDGGPGEPA